MVKKSALRSGISYKASLMVSQKRGDSFPCLVVVEKGLAKQDVFVYIVGNFALVFRLCKRGRGRDLSRKRWRMSAFFRPVHAVLLQRCDAPYELVVHPETNTKDVKIGGRYVLHDGRETRVLTWLNDYMSGGANGLIATLQRLEVQDDTEQNTGNCNGYTNALDALGSVCTGVAYWVRNEVGQKAAEEIAELKQKHAEEKAALEGQLKAACEARDDFAKAAWRLQDELKKQLAAAKRLARQKRKGK